ncbi:type II secretion system F family protein [Phenylobacterium sp.]|uniref:type II secretion system F family protein n=1 Tax=Phenylobacterium sp. TaxID=1871053 RepID=UPI00286DDE64|nr:type II secretion system F family protein [Phenylobacterium sp.]
MADDLHFRYLAMDPAGRRVRGVVAARDDAVAFDSLRREGLSPLSLTPHKLKAKAAPKHRNLSDREAAEFLGSLADLLMAGADIRTALSILGARFERASVKVLAQGLADDISGGEALERAFGRHFRHRQAFVGPMIAAGEAAGDLPGGLQRASEIVASRLKLRDQLITVLAYPAFVLVSAIAAVFVILLFIVPSIAPLAEELGGAPPPALAILIRASLFLTNNLVMLGGLGALTLLLLGVAWRLGLLSAPLERAVLDGPAKRTTRGLVFGAFSISLGAMLAAGAPISDALRLATRSVGTASARRRLEPVISAVRQGQSLSNALAEVKGFPPSIIRLATVGEASNALGQMLAKGGKLEEDAAMRRIETIGRLAGPALIILLGAILGVLMGGLLSGVSQMGQSALE